MRITFVVAVYPPESEPTAVMASELAQHWSKQGHSVTVICTFPNRPHGVIYKGFRRRPWLRTGTENLRILRLWTWLIGRKRRHLNRILENVSFGVTSSIALLFLKKPDVLILESWAIAAQFMNVTIARIRRIPVVNYVKDLYPEAMNAAGMLEKKSLLHKIMLHTDRAVCRSAACSIVISEKMKDTLVESRSLPPEKVKVVRDWLDLDTIHPFDGANTWRSDVGIPKDDVVFMFAGTMGYASGVDILVEVADLLRDIPGIRIVCVGEGHLKEVLIRGKSQRNLSNLTILDFQPRQRVNEMQSSADAMLLITSVEMGMSSVPSKLITYLAVGKPVLCAVQDTSDIADLVKTTEIGLVVPPGDATKIKEGIIELAAMGRDLLSAKGRKAREVAQQRFSISRATQEFDALLAEVTHVR